MSSVLDSQLPPESTVSVMEVTLMEAMVVADTTNRVHVAIYDGDKSRLKCGAPSEFRKMGEGDYARFFRSALPQCGNCIIS